MNTRQMIATTVLAFSVVVPAAAFAGTVNSQGDATTSLHNTDNKREQTTRMAVLNEYQNAVQSGQFNRAAGDAGQSVISGKSTATRAEVMGKITGLDLSKGDAS